MREEFESVLYHQRLAHKAWLNKAFARGVAPGEQVSQLVWELLVIYSEAVDDFDAVADDIFKAAYELAILVLPNTTIDEVYKLYRDDLTEAIIDYTDDSHPEQLRSLVRFSNLVSSAICEAGSDLVKSTLRHKRAERFSQEIKVAKRIQAHLLPKAVPSIAGFEFAGRLVPAEEIGGDYWSVKYQAPDDLVTLKLADITGHGIAAATLVAAVKFISGGYYKGSKSAAEVMEQTNRILTLDTPHEILVSMVYGWLRPRTYELTIVNAGHSPAFICSNTACTDLPLTGPMLGLAEDAEYGEVTFQLQKGDLVFFGSDGITEAGAPERFGLTRLKEIVLGSKEKPADEIADMVVGEVARFAGRAQDDVSLVIVKVVGDPPKATVPTKRGEGKSRARAE